MKTIFKMKTLFKMIAIVALALGMNGLLMAQSKAGDRPKKAARTNGAAPKSGAEAGPDKKAGEESAKTTGHIIPVDGGLQDAFLR